VLPPAVGLGASLIGAVQDLPIGPVRAVMVIGRAVLGGMVLGLLVEGMAGMVEVVGRGPRPLPSRIRPGGLSAANLLQNKKYCSNQTLQKTCLLNVRSIPDITCRISGQIFSKILLNIGKCFHAVAYFEKQNSVEEKSVNMYFLRIFVKKNTF
jgi:hypothetical protein